MRFFVKVSIANTEIYKVIYLKKIKTPEITKVKVDRIAKVDRIDIEKTKTALSMFLYGTIAMMAFCFVVSCKSSQVGETSKPDRITLADPSKDVPVKVDFTEVWAYYLTDAKHQNDLKDSFAAKITDIGYFGADVNTYGTLTDVPSRKKISAKYTGRVHLVVTCSSYALTHFVLDPVSPIHRQLVKDLLAAAEDYDGLQIDFELIPKRDGGTFLSFLNELRKGLGNKSLTVALPARTKTIQDDVYDYKNIGAVVDRIIVMAYDEHWSTSRPGPIASMRWCKNVGQYSLDTLGAEKLVMGVPFYGRTWGNVTTNKAYFHEGIMRINKEYREKASDIKREDGIPMFTYEMTEKMTAYYDDAFSLTARLDMYKNMGITKTGFWCLGQEDPDFWKYLSVTK
ncbi:MAG: hypothetical protein Ta2A_05950 [Treponemataceae bacterium]|nr:MAG: hypothetical protein Ta2A_05950 [Treponemataceae bacterium]